MTQVEIQFISVSPKTTRIKFEHKDLHKLGGGKTVESMSQGWGMIMELYKKQTEL